MLERDENGFSILTCPLCGELLLTICKVFHHSKLYVACEKCGTNLIVEGSNVEDLKCFEHPTVDLYDGGA